MNIALDLDGAAGNKTPRLTSRLARTSLISVFVKETLNIPAILASHGLSNSEYNLEYNLRANKLSLSRGLAHKFKGFNAFSIQEVDIAWTLAADFGCAATFFNYRKGLVLVNSVSYLSQRVVA